ncbi:MAG: hypothetical protein EXR73_09820 [Myxococcales bacterium]|nr:hypothetical protein [Myxococcales bacterium]
MLRRLVPLVVLAAVVALAAVACTSDPPRRRVGVAKPGAPVTLALDAHATGAGRHRVTLRATATADLPWLELRLDGTHAQSGPIARGETRQLAVEVVLGAAAFREIVGVAAAPVGSGTRTRAAIQRIGVPATVHAPPPPRVVTLPGGERVAEVRP